MSRINFLTSLNFTILLLIFLALVLIVGTVVPQNLTEFEYLSRYSADSYKILKCLGIFDIYHSWWLVSLLFLLCVNLIVCSIKNFPRLKRSLSQVNEKLTDFQLKNLPFKVTLRKNCSEEEAKKKVAAVLKKFFHSQKEITDQAGVYFFCQKYRYSRWGFFITHLSIVIILIGGMISSLWGIKGWVKIREGETVNQILLPDHTKYRLDFDIKCDAFAITYYPDGTPRDYKTTLTIFEKGVKQLTKVIEVNHPLKYRGFSFYQESFGEAPDPTGEIILRVRKRGREEGEKVVSLRPGESFSLFDPGWVVKVNRFFTDFVRDEKGEVFNRSFELRNPALELLIFKEGKLKYQTWVFQRFPDFHGSKGEYQFLIQDIKKKVYTGLQVNRDPGVNVVWLGCILIILGIFLTFFFFHYQLWVWIKPKKDGLALIIAGNAHKNRSQFKKIWEEIRIAIDQTF